MNRILAQTGALFVDAYRELNAKKLFWITLILSLGVVSVFAAFGIGERGLTFLWWTIPIEQLNSGVIPPRLFYVFAFTQLGIPIWLTWVQTILALVSTASIFPDFISGGAVELVLSKPISRARLFLTKYVCGLLFAGLQVLAFTLASFVVIGIRGESWEWGIFLAVPIVLAFFSFLFCVCTLLGLLTRSTIASLMLTLLFWFGVFSVNIADQILISIQENADVRLEQAEEKIEARSRAARAEIDRLRSAGESPEVTDGPMPEQFTDRLEMVNPFLAGARKDAEKARELRDGIAPWSQRVYLLKSVFPKTEETIKLLDRHLITDEQMAQIFAIGEEDNSEETQTNQRIEQRLRDRSVAWVLGTSFAFEGVILGACLWIFCRRDF